MLKTTAAAILVVTSSELTSVVTPRLEELGYRTVHTCDERRPASRFIDIRPDLVVVEVTADISGPRLVTQLSTAAAGAVAVPIVAVAPDGADRHALCQAGATEVVARQAAAETLEVVMDRLLRGRHAALVSMLQRASYAARALRRLEGVEEPVPVG